MDGDNEVIDPEELLEMGVLGLETTLPVEITTEDDQYQSPR